MCCGSCWHLGRSASPTERGLIMKLILIEQLHEAVQGDWVYRIRTNEHGVMIRRTNKDRVLWSHGVLTQMFDRKANSFLPSNVCGSDVYFMYMDDALAVIKAQG